MAPSPLPGVVEDGEPGLAGGADPQTALVVRDKDVDLPLGDREIHVVNEPRIGQPKHLGVELDIAHGCPPWNQARGSTPEATLQVSLPSQPFATAEPGVKGRAKPEREPQRQRRLAADP